MTLTLEGRVEVLEGKVKNPETWAGPGQSEGLADNLADLRRRFDKFGEIQAKQSQTLDMHTGKLGTLERAVNDLAFNMHVLKGGLAELKDETSGKLERLDNDVTALKVDVGGLKGDVVELGSELTEFKAEVTGTLREILERLPAKAA